MDAVQDHAMRSRYGLLPPWGRNTGSPSLWLTRGSSRSTWIIGSGEALRRLALLESRSGTVRAR